MRTRVHPRRVVAGLALYLAAAAAGYLLVTWFANAAAGGIA